MGFYSPLNIAGNNAAHTGGVTVLAAIASLELQGITVDRNNP